MKTKLILLLILFSFQFLRSQNYQTVEDLNDACASLGFSANEDAEIAVDKILDAVGLFRNFVIQECPDINNAVAKVIEISEDYKERYILYDNSFFSSMDEKAATDWASMSILAHEIGHHLNGHSLNKEGSNHKFELEADYFSGSALAKLGATLEEAQSAIATFRYDKATRTHPAKIDRLAAIEKGWKSASKFKKVEVNAVHADNIDLFEYDSAMIEKYETKAYEAYNVQSYLIAASNFLKAFQFSNGTKFEDLYNTASSYIGVGEYDTALKYYLALIRKGIDSLEREKQELTYKNIGLIYMNQDKGREALQFFDFALRKTPNDESILLAKADIYYKTGDIETFKNELQKVLKINPNNSKVLFNLGVLAVGEGDSNMGINYYEQCLSINPNYKDAILNIVATILLGENQIIEEMNSLGNSSTDNKRYDELKLVRQQLYKDAVTYCERYIKLDNTNQDMLNTTAAIYSVLGDDSNYKRIKRMQN